MFHSFFFLIWTLFSIDLGGAPLHRPEGSGTGSHHRFGHGIGHPH